MGPDYAIPGTTFPINELLDAGDFGLQFDFKFESDHEVESVALQFRSHEFSLDPSGAWTFFENSDSEKARISSGKTEIQSQKNTMLIVLYGGNLGVYLNNTLLYSADDIPLNGMVNRIIVSGDHGSSIDFDNFKFWNLDG